MNASDLIAKQTDFLTQGKSTKAGVTEKDVDPKELAMGIQVELEHTSDSETAKKIALDHLAEFSTYYTALKAMEDKLKGQEKKAAVMIDEIVKMAFYDECKKLLQSK